MFCRHDERSEDGELRQGSTAMIVAQRQAKRDVQLSKRRNLRKPVASVSIPGGEPTSCSQDKEDTPSM